MPKVVGTIHAMGQHSQQRVVLAVMAVTRMGKIQIATLKPQPRQLMPVNVLDRKYQMIMVS